MKKTKENDKEAYLKWLNYWSKIFKRMK